MTKRMLIDSTNAEETRVVVLDGNRLEEFDLETSTKHQLKGNIYLAKVVRVEPSLQAAFVEYGGNRHGFLAFGEIHPDYYQIPVADRKRLLEAQEQEAREDEEAEEQAAAAQDRGRASRAARPSDETASVETMAASGADDVDPTLSAASNDHPADVETDAEPIETISSDADTESRVDDDSGIDPVPPEDRMVVAQPATIVADLMIAPEEASMLFPEQPGDMAGAAESAASDEAERGEETEPSSGEQAELFAGGSAEPFSEPAQEFSGEQLGGEPAEESAGEAPEQFGGENDTEEADRRSTPRFLRHYKIQEVIRRRQVLLIQVVKEERGSKGAALTTYMSLAGRFSVLMPNSPRGGGISRKITSASDRRRLKEVTAELDLPRGMGLIVRTAGANRPKPEILRDCEYLLNQWDQIRELTMKSMAPALIYEEASLIKRAIRDVYSRDVDDILVDGEQGWRAARDFMRMLMPTHAKKVQLWKEPQPLFAKAQVEQQLEGMLQPTVQLRSGGYLVINQTEALVAIDVNSGRSTRERGIEETALKTNLEAAEEAARQLRLRDLAGLIVIDFIDMESRRNVAAVERKLKDALKHDRARIQVGGISHFGLLEMSRQRLRPSLAEANFVTCTHCGGTGHMRSTESAALVTLRAIEDEGGRRRAAEIMVHCASSIALYILNHKRQRLTDIEVRYSMIVAFVADETLRPPELRIEKIRAQTAMDAPAPISQLAPPEPFEDPDEIEINADSEESDDGLAEESNDEADAGTDETPSAAGGADAEGADSAERRGRRRRRRRGGRREEGAVASVSTDGSDDRAGDDAGDSSGDFGPDEAGDDAAGAVAESTGTGDVTGNGDADGEEAGSETVVAGTTAESGAVASADVEEGERRRRGRRGGRRRRRDGSEAEGAASAAPSSDEGFAEPAPVSVTPAYTPPAYVPPAYEGPTPANPFGGASAFDIFDAIEQAEEQRLTQRKPVATSMLEPEPVPETAAALAPELVSKEPEAEPVAQPASELMAQTAEPIEEAAQTPVAVAPVPDVVPEPEVGLEPEVGPTSAPLIQPTLIGGEAEPVEKKRGWWRR